MNGAWARADRILAVRLDGAGDLLMTSPALAAIKESRPDAELGLLVSPVGAPVAALLPMVDEVVTYAAPWVKSSPPRRAGTVDRALIAELAGNGYDAAVIFAVNSQSPLPAALTCHLAGIPLRAAYCRENPYQLLTDWFREPEPDVPRRHEVRRQLDLVGELGFGVEDEHLRLRVPAAAIRRARALLAEEAILPAERWLLVHPGATAPSRRWPADRYAAVVRRLADRGIRSVVCGTDDDALMVETVAAAGAHLVETPSFADLAALVTVAPLLLANNSAAAHVAAAVGTPVVVLYALTNPQHTPWQVRSRVLSEPVPCAGCRRSVCPLGHHRCLRGVSVDDAVHAVEEMLGSAGGIAQPAMEVVDLRP